MENVHDERWRAGQTYAAELEERIRPHLRMSNGSWRVDETYVKVKGRWTYLYRTVDSRGHTIDFLLSAKRDAEAAKRFFRKGVGPASLGEPAHYHRGQEPSISEGGRRDEGQWRTLAPLTVAPGEVPEQHCWTGPPRDQTPDPFWAWLWRLLDGATNARGPWGDGDDQEGASPNIGGDDIRAQAAFTAELFQLVAWRDIARTLWKVAVNQRQTLQQNPR
jgi:hypothetical protein